MLARNPKYDKTFKIDNNVQNVPLSILFENPRAITDHSVCVCVCVCGVTAAGVD